MSTLQLIEQRGELRGEQRGKIQNKEQVIIKAFKQGADIKFIAKITELSMQKVRAILKEKG